MFDILYDIQLEASNIHAEMTKARSPAELESSHIYLLSLGGGVVSVRLARKPHQRIGYRFGLFNFASETLGGKVAV
jgi:hypothetical protein